ncbi:MAG: multicopper oxidase domain-containing protein [Vicinamibacterales bacterium]
MRHALGLMTPAILAVVLVACGVQAPATSSQTGQPSQAAGPAGPPLTTRNMPAVAGQQKTCAGPREKAFDLDVIETTGIDLGMGFTFAAWAYNGHIPGPTIEACEGDTVTINVHNKGTTAHGLDTHAFKIDARKYGPTPPGTTLKMEKAVDTPGVFMYHCAAGPVTDLHIKSGIHGAMIVYPRNEILRPAREIVVVQDAVFGTQDAKGFIPGTDPARTQKNDQLFSMFNGRLDNEAVRVNPGDLVRMYFVNVGPWTSAAHVIGTVLDRVYAGAPFVQGVQTYAVPAGSGAILEFYIPEAGVFPFVDHDKLAYLPFGLALAFASEGVPAAAH